MKWLGVFSLVVGTALVATACGSSQTGDPSGGGGGGGALCSGKPECPLEGCTFEKAVARCKVEGEVDTRYTTKPCGGYDIIGETSEDDYYIAYYFDHATGKLAATESDEEGVGKICTGPADFQFPSCDDNQDDSASCAPNGQGGSGSGGDDIEGS
jgi:hypothetical protein